MRQLKPLQLLEEANILLVQDSWLARHRPGERLERPVTATTIGTHCKIIPELLRQAGLRPTRQRIALGTLLFSGHDRHVTAEGLHAEVQAAGEQVSLATVYNTLHQFTGAGLLRELAVEGSKTYFDTNTSNHSHFYVEDKGEILDIAGAALTVDGLPEPPEGMRISHVDVVVRLVKA
jgi:Fur family iron response transcriptional regulator